jgi:AraC-like DNA-binding protein
MPRGAALDDVARARGESPRTLQRRLEAVGLTWRALRDAVREDEARLLLEQGQRSLPDIAEALGFSDQSVFARAFSRWTGVSPSRYRREAAAHRRQANR